MMTKQQAIAAANGSSFVVILEHLDEPQPKRYTIARLPDSGVVCVGNVNVHRSPIATQTTAAASFGISTR